MDKILQLSVVFVCISAYVYEWNAYAYVCMHMYDCLFVKLVSFFFITYLTLFLCAFV